MFRAISGRCFAVKAGYYQRQVSFVYLRLKRSCVAHWWRRGLFRV